MKGELELEAIISLHCSSENAIMKLYVEFVKADGAGPSSTIIATNVGTEAEAESPTTRLCDGFTGLLQSSYYDVLEESIGRHFSISRTDFNFDNHY